MPCSNITIKANYKLSGLTNWFMNYKPEQTGFVGQSVSEDFSKGILNYEYSDIQLGNVQFINTTTSLITFPPQYKILENIIITLENGSCIYGTHYRETTSISYLDGEEVIFTINSCDGVLSGYVGFIIINSTLNDRFVTILLEKNKCLY